MKICAFNGSPRGAKGNTHVVAEAFLRGAEAEGAEVESILLVDKKIRHCSACLSCWVRTPGKCSQSDDAAELLDKVINSDVAVFATPVYIHNVSGRMKDFMDRLIPLIDPRFGEVTETDTFHLARYERYPKLVALATGAFPDHNAFDVLRLLFRRTARSMHTELVGEVYRSYGNLLRLEHPLLKPIVADYLKLVESAGAELVREGRLSEETTEALQRPLIPKAMYVAEGNKAWDKMEAKAKAEREAKAKGGAE